jgi:protein-tyrosine sulfotransferase
MNAQAGDGIILLGAPRSGTTLLRRLLNWHPDISCGGETFLLTAAARFLRADSIADGIDYGVLGGLQAAGFSEERVLGDLRALVTRYLEEMAARDGKRVWAAKTAIDSFYVAEIEKLFAGRARFVCLLRHGLDVAISLKDLSDANEMYLRELHDYIVRWPRPLEAFAHAWADVTTALLGLAERQPESTFLLRYEDLVADPAAELRELTDFLGLAPGASMLAALTEDRPAGLGDWKTFARTGIDAASIDRWQALGDAAQARLAPIVNPVLARSGYPEIVAGAPPTPAQAMRRYELSMSLQASRSRAARDKGD